MVINFEVPPLRQRLHDLLTIANYFREHYSRTFKMPAQPFSKELAERMHFYEWPGNIRELESFVCRYMILGSGEPSLNNLSAKFTNTEVNALLRPWEPLLEEVAKRTLAEVERKMITRALGIHGGSLRQAARSLGISSRELMNKMDQAGLPRARYKTRMRPEEPPEWIM